MSGHSKWSTIKRAKGATDAKRGQLFTKLAREITVAARSGVPDPDSNTRLRIAIQKARGENMPKDNIDRAIERAKGGTGSESLDEILYEGYGPGGVAFMIQAMTDNRNRTVGEVRAAFTRGGGNLGADGAVAWMFDNVGQIVASPGNLDPDEVALLAIDSGALEFEIDDESVIVYTEPQELHRVSEQIAASGIDIESSELIMKPKDPVTPDVDLAVKVIRLVERLEDLDDVQTVYTNLNLTDDVIAQVS
jgi:YebC/PmpR family DNA-binding regulatory protein